MIRVKFFKNVMFNKMAHVLKKTRRNVIKMFHRDGFCGW